MAVSSGSGDHPSARRGTRAATQAPSFRLLSVQFGLDYSRRELWPRFCD
ncbi:hypothetical protein [Caudoviricetes sp.]|nr:hypothetical protein [Caudoviricetes sp.]UOF82764.1 hypothetical protein [Caudoviricetes sp.]